MKVSSEAGGFHNAYCGDYPYALSKSGMNMFSEQLRNYLKKKASLCMVSIRDGSGRTWEGRKHRGLLEVGY